MDGKTAPSGSRLLKSKTAKNTIGDPTSDGLSKYKIMDSKETIIKIAIVRPFQLINLQLNLSFFRHCLNLFHALPSIISVSPLLGARASSPACNKLNTCRRRASNGLKARSITAQGKGASRRRPGGSKTRCCTLGNLTTSINIVHQIQLCFFNNKICLP